MLDKETTEDWLEPLGETVFFEMACDYLGYNTMLAEVSFTDAVQNGLTSTVTLFVNEPGKVAKKVKFKIQIEEN